MKKIRNIIMGLLLILPFGVSAAPQLVLTFDDGSSVASWLEYRHIFDKYNAKVTFYISRYTDQVRGAGLDTFLLEMQAAGHRIGYHGTKHLNAPEFVALHGMQGYINVEILPDLVHMREDGFVLEHFAYPGGNFTRETDIELSRYFKTLRYVTGGESKYLGIAGKVAAPNRLTFHSIRLGRGSLAGTWPVIDEVAASGDILFIHSHRIGYYDSLTDVTPEALESLIVYALDKGFVISPLDYTP